MVLRINDKPKFVDNPVRIDPYEEVWKAVDSNNYKKCAKILKGEGSVREQASFPAVLLRMNQAKYINLIKGVMQFGAEKELFFCFKMARSLSREFHDSQNISKIELILADVDISKLPKILPYAEFKHIFYLYGCSYGYRSSA